MNLKSIAGFLTVVGIFGAYKLYASAMEPNVMMGVGVVVALCGFTALGLTIYDHKHPKLQGEQQQ